MTSPSPFSVTIAQDVPPAERARLLLALQSRADVQTGAAKDPTVDTVVVIFKAVGEAATAAASVVTLAKAILDWRREAQQRAAKTKLELKRASQPPLDLESASEDELVAWLLDQAPER